MPEYRFRTEKQKTSRGYSRWVTPRMHSYMLACCDCSLVHEMQFRLVAGRIDKKSDPSGQKVHVQFRARRAERLTKQQRAKRKK